jgi:hypothetical protein
MRLGEPRVTDHDILTPGGAPDMLVAVNPPG